MSTHWWTRRREANSRTPICDGERKIVQRAFGVNFERALN
jgi:hypothetical protein